MRKNAVQNNSEYGHFLRSADPTDKSEKCKIYDAVTYDLYCPSMAISNPDYVCPYVQCQRIFTTKELLKLHLKSTRHHAYVDEVI